MTPALVNIPTLETDRCVLRAPRASDFDTYAAFRASPRSVGVGGPYTRERAFEHFCALFGHWIMRGFGRWILADKVSDAPLGLVGLYHPLDWPEPEIGWSLFDGAEGRGLAHEAALAVRTHAYGTLGWRTVVSLTRTENTRSIALARRMGARLDSELQHPTLGPLQVWRHLPPEEC